MASALENLRSKTSDLDALHAALSMMEWDQQTYMPRGGAEARAEHVGLLSRMHHEILTSDEMKKALEGAGSDAKSDDEIAMLRVVKRDIDQATKIPTALVEEKSKLASQAHETWVIARQNNDFKSFAPILARMFEIAKEEAKYLGYKDHPYDALTDLYEEGATESYWRQMYESIKGPQIELVKQIKESGKNIDDSKLYGEWDEEKQKAFTEMLVKEIGFDMERGRQDTAAHPFCTGWSVGDVRLTTRYKPYVGSAIFGSLHEAGHGMYEQGSPMSWDRSPLCGGVSLGVHESQSRTWENLVGRSKSFWQRYLPDLQKTFPALSSFNLDSWYQAINKVEPSYIRVEADEVTYNLHTLVRFEIECDMLTGKMNVNEMPEVWNAKYKEYLGITPRNDAEGCLQDVHWSGGSIGYFPTYSMGNLLSYQIWDTMKKDVGDVDALMAKGQFKEILGWLRDKVYSQGKKYPPRELVKRVTGKPLDASAYLEGLGGKYREIYGL